ncbi:QueT transporter family protein [Candidatus Bathyarchaeota archaeon]|nr:QueT transporter family protein [Candidatus Bathyarchaeota archaeon]
MKTPGSYNTGRSRTRQLTLASAIAALYALLVSVLPATSIPIIQVRIADVLMPLSILFGWPAVIGVTIGAGLGNLVGDTLLGNPGSVTGVDVVFGSLANFVASFLAWKISNRSWTIRGVRASWIVAVNSETIVIALVVGSYLGWLFSIPLLISIAGILVGSIIAISIAGYTLLLILSQERTLDSLRSTGLVVGASRPLEALPSKLDPAQL